MHNGHERENRRAIMCKVDMKQGDNGMDTNENYWPYDSAQDGKDGQLPEEVAIFLVDREHSEPQNADQIDHTYTRQFHQHLGVRQSQWEERKKYPVSAGGRQMESSQIGRPQSMVSGR